MELGKVQGSPSTEEWKPSRDDQSYLLGYQGMDLLNVGPSDVGAV